MAHPDVHILQHDERVDLVDLQPSQVEAAFPDATYLFIQGGTQRVFALCRTTHEALLHAVEDEFGQDGKFAGEDPAEFGIIAGPTLQAQTDRYLAARE